MHNDDGDSIISLHTIHSTVQTLISDATELLDGTLLFGKQPPRQVSVATLQDDACNLKGRSFRDHPENGLQATSFWLTDQLADDADLFDHFVCPPFSTEQDPHLTALLGLSGARYRKNAIHDYFKANQNFLQYMAVIIILTSPIPMSEAEMANITWRNHSSPRNLRIHMGDFILVTTIRGPTENKPAARFLPSVVGNLLARYLAYVEPFLSFFLSALRLPRNRPYLFTDEKGEAWRPEQFSECMRQSSDRLMGQSLSVSEWRKIAIAIDRRDLGGKSCKLYGVD
jgi:hypothetical protein